MKNDDCSHFRLLRRPDGMVLPMPIFDLTYDQSSNAPLIRKLARNGVGTFSARTALLFGGGAEEAACIEQFVERMDFIAENAPEASLLLSVGLKPSRQWRRNNPSEIYQSRDGLVCLCEEKLEGHFPRASLPEEEILRAAQPSVFSEIENEAAAQSIRNLFDALLTRPCGGRLVGAFLGKYTYGEWAVMAWYADYSPPARRFLARFLAEKYQGDVELMRRAWNDPAATFEEPRIPWRESFYRQLNLGGLPLAPQATRDYLEAAAMAVGGKFYRLCRAVKEVDPRYIAGGFHAYGQTFQAEIRSFLGDGTIDFTATPFEYWNRHPGSGISPQSPYQHMPQQHNAVYFDELDTRTHYAGIEQTNIGRARNADESVGVLWRDAGHMLVNGHAGWWLDFGGDRSKPNRPSWHIHPNMLEFHRRFRQLWDEVESYDLSPVGDVRVFFPRRNNHLLLWDLTLVKRVEFPLAGLQVEEHELDDLLQGLVAPGRLNILFWPYSLTDGEMEAIRSLMAGHDGDWCFYGPSGLMKPDVSTMPEIERMEELTGFDLQVDWLSATREAGCTYHPSPLHPDGPGFVLGAVPRGRLAEDKLCTLPMIGLSQKPLYSLNRFYKPGDTDLRKKPEPPLRMPLGYRISILDREGCEPLAAYEDGATAFAARKTRRGNVYCYPMQAFNSDMFRVLAGWAGGNVYVEEDCFLCATRGLLLLHQARDGSYTVQLPPGSTSAHDLIRDRPIEVNNRRLVLSGKRGTTHLLKLD